MNVRKRSSLWRRVARRLARDLFRVAENNDDPRIERNGERWLLRELVASHVREEEGVPLVVIDAGANTGGYSRLVLQTAQGAGCPVEVHGFEPSPSCVKELRAQFADEPAFRVVGKALGERNGDMLLYDGSHGSSQASLVSRAEHSGDNSAAISVPVMRLADYLTSNSMTRVSLLKLDVEGYELAALLGLGESLRPDLVDVIQFEYGGTALDARTTLRDLYRLLEGRGYVLAKLFPSMVEVRPYRSWMEHYAYANYVALAPRWCRMKASAK